MKYNKIITDLSNELNLPSEVVDKVYKAYWKFIKDTISSIPLITDNYNESEFKSLRTSFNIPSIGKLFCTFENYNNIKNRYQNNRCLK